MLRMQYLKPGRTTLAALTMLAIIVSCASETAAPGNADQAYWDHSSVFKMDSREIVLAPDQGIEIKYHLDEGAPMLYSWRATAIVPFEFHGEPDVRPAGAPDDYYESHEKDDDGKDQSHGHFISPSTGIHGWWWENTGQDNVTIQLTTAGFYNWAKEFSAAGVRDLEIQEADSRPQ